MSGPSSRSRFAIVALAAAALAPVLFARPQQSNGNAPAPNTLTRAEASAGWKLLFDGKTDAGWRGFHRDKFPDEGWVVEDGAFRHTKGSSANAGDIITVGEYDNFEFQADWKIPPGGNSGIKYLISEDLIKTGHAGLGFEMQVLDDDLNPDAKLGKNGNRTAGALYDLIAPKNKVLKPVGQWNTVRLMIKSGHVEHWMNGGKILEFDIGSPEMKALIADSKYRVNPGFGEVRKGHILLQDHNEEVWYRSLKIRELR
jgi:3-keto-disaccharide hydrolase